MNQTRNEARRPLSNSGIAAILTTGALVASCAMAPVALASEVTPSAGAQTGSGTTEVTVQLKGGAGEVGGAGSEGNPDQNGDTYGDNISFSVPTSINFVADAAGVLSGPSNATIQNHSKFPIHASSLQVDAETGWNIVADASATTLANAIDFQIGPTANMLNASSYLTKDAISTPSAWNMAAGNGAVSLGMTGDINNVTANLSVQIAVATLHWFVTPGAAS